MTSGARYHRVATYSVMYAFPPPAASGGGWAEERARPKSQIWCERSERGDALASVGASLLVVGKGEETYFEVTVCVE